VKFTSDKAQVIQHRTYDGGMPKVDERRRRPGWLTLAWLFLLLALASVADAAWSAIVEGEWWSLLTLPIAVLFWYWLVGGALRRAHA